MGRIIDEQRELSNLVLYQLRTHWIDIDEDVILSAIPRTISEEEIKSYTSHIWGWR